jgi:galactosamine-6-phosphate isomerase
MDKTRYAIFHAFPVIQQLRLSSRKRLRMQRIIESTYEALGERAASDLLQLVQGVQAPLICPTSGSTPAALYSALVKLLQKESIDYSHWHFVGLDEWAGMNGNDVGSCRHFVNQTLFEPLGIREEQICFFDGRAADPKKECTRVEAFIQQQGGITAAIVGLGLNGHVGMNEPGTPASLRAHVAQIAEETRVVGQKYFDSAKELSKGLTLGLATLLDAKHVFLVANGTKKAAIVQKISTEAPTEALPATLLKNHPGFRMYLDAEAAALLD